MTKLTILIVLIVLAAGILAGLGWREWAKHRLTPAGPGWRSGATLAALISLSLAALLFVAYAAHNTAVGGDRNGNATILLCIRFGNYLSLAAMLLGLVGNGRGRWLALVGGCFTLFLWVGQGMSL
jgi:hypothetical protein